MSFMPLSIWKNPHRLIFMGEMLLSILNGFSSFLQTRRTTIKARKSLNFGKIPLLTLELSALEHLKNQ